MKNILFKYIILLLLFLILCPELYSQGQKERALADNPTQLKEYLVDETGILTPLQHKDILVKLVNEDKTTSNQIVVYIINSLNGESIEDVSINLRKIKSERKTRITAY